MRSKVSFPFPDNEPRQHHRIKKKTLGARRLFPLLRRALTSGLFCDPMLLDEWSLAGKAFVLTFSLKNKRSYVQAIILLLFLWGLYVIADLLLRKQ